MTSGSFWARAPANDNSAAPAPISAVAAARKMVLSKPSAGGRIAALLVSVPVNCFVTLKLVAAFANVESDQAIRGDRIGILEIPDSLRAGKTAGNVQDFRLSGRSFMPNSAAILSFCMQIPCSNRNREFSWREQGMNPSEQGIPPPRATRPKSLRMPSPATIILKSYELSYHNSPLFSRERSHRHGCARRFGIEVNRAITKVASTTLPAVGATLVVAPRGARPGPLSRPLRPPTTGRPQGSPLRHP